MRKKIKRLKKVNPYRRRIVLTLRVNSDEYRELLKKAHGFTSGRVGEWLRHAGLTHVPSKKELEK